MRSLSIVVLAALLAVGCSGDDDEPVAEPGPATDEAATSVGSSTTTTTLRPPVPTDPPRPPEAMIGDLVLPCSPTDLTPIVDAVGITDASITIGTGSDRGGIGTPGAGVGIIEMVEALADHCNAHGGLHGRDIRVIEYDAAAVETVDRVRRACEEVSALVGHAFLQLIEEALTAIDCGLARYPSGPGLLPPTPVRLHGHLTAAFADPAASRIVLVGPDTPVEAAARVAHEAAVTAAGGVLEVVGTVPYPIDRVPDWDRVVGDARATGAGQVVIVGGCDQAVIPFIEVADRAGWAPMILASATAYEAGCLDVATPERLLLELPFLPFEDGDAAPAAAAHEELLALTAAPRTGTGLLAASAFWRWAVDTAACPTSVGEDCASPLAGLDWSAGGLHPPVSPDGTSPGCAVVMGIEDGAFVRRLPVEPGTYECEPVFSAPLPD